MAKRKDLVEIFGYSPDDLTHEARSLWEIGACPFIRRPCVKHNHDQSIVYGTCSVTSPYGDVIICPNRLYDQNYHLLQKVSADAFGDDVPFLMYDQYVDERANHQSCVVALGQNSGREVQVGRSLSMDWVLARISDGKLIEYTGIEIQSIDITGNYRDAWHAYKNLSEGTERMDLPSSAHGLNWANVHKRLIPQLIRKGVVYSRSKMVNKGVYFILPDIVYQKFEDVIGADIPLLDGASRETLTVYTYELGPHVSHGSRRELVQTRKIRFALDEFADRFISGPNLPSGEELDSAVKTVLGVQ